MTKVGRLLRANNGQAAVELVASIPLIALVAALLVQALLTGHSWLVLNQAAGAAARELAVTEARGQPAQRAAERLARRALPAQMRSIATVQFDGDRVTVARRVPTLAPFGALATKLPHLKSSARFTQ